MKEDYQKASKKLALPFLSNSVPFHGQDYEKQKGPGTSNQSLFKLKNKFRKIPLLVMHNLSKLDDVIFSGFGVIPKITSSNLCKSIIIPLSFVFLNLESVKRKGKNIKIFRTKRAF